jgi:hypothetical protein
MPNVYPAQFGLYARDMRIQASQMPMAQLWKEMEILDEIVHVQSRTIGVTIKVEIAIIAIGDELQKRIYGKYPCDTFRFQ